MLIRRPVFSLVLGSLFSVSLAHASGFTCRNDSKQEAFTAFFREGSQEKSLESARIAEPAILKLLNDYSGEAPQTDAFAYWNGFSLLPHYKDKMFDRYFGGEDFVGYWNLHGHRAFKTYLYVPRAELPNATFRGMLVGEWTLTFGDSDDAFAMHVECERFADPAKPAAAALPAAPVPDDSYVPRPTERRRGK